VPVRALARVNLAAIERNCGRLRTQLHGGAELGVGKRGIFLLEQCPIFVNCSVLADDLEDLQAGPVDPWHSGSSVVGKDDTWDPAHPDGFVEHFAGDSGEFTPRLPDDFIDGRATLGWDPRDHGFDGQGELLRCAFLIVRRRQSCRIVPRRGKAAAVLAV